MGDQNLQCYPHLCETPSLLNLLLSTRITWLIKIIGLQSMHTQPFRVILLNRPTKVLVCFFHELQMQRHQKAVIYKHILFSSRPLIFLTQNKLEILCKNIYPHLLDFFIQNYYFIFLFSY